MTDAQEKTALVYVVLMAAVQMAVDPIYALVIALITHHQPVVAQEHDQEIYQSALIAPSALFQALVRMIVQIAPEAVQA